MSEQCVNEQRIEFLEKMLDGAMCRLAKLEQRVAEMNAHRLGQLADDLKHLHETGFRSFG